MICDAATEGQFIALATALNNIGIVYVHMVDHAAMGANPISRSVKDGIRNAFGSTIILSGGYDANHAEANLEVAKGELVAFGRPFPTW